MPAFNVMKMLLGSTTRPACFEAMPLSKRQGSPSVGNTHSSDQSPPAEKVSAGDGASSPPMAAIEFLRSRPETAGNLLAPAGGDESSVQSAQGTSTQLAISEAAGFPITVQTLSSLTEADYVRLSGELLDNGLASIQLSEVETNEMLGIVKENDGDFHYYDLDENSPFAVSLLNIANKIHELTHEQLNNIGGELGPRSMQIKRWGDDGGVKHLHQDGYRYPVVMGITLSDSAQMQYVDRSNMHHLSRDPDVSLKVANFSPRDSFDESRHISHVGKHQLVIFNSRNEFAPSDKPSLVHQSPPDSAGRTIGLFRFEYKSPQLWDIQKGRYMQFY